MKKGDMSTSALFSLVLVVLVAALVIYLLYTWTGKGSDAFEGLIRMPAG